MYLTQGFQRSIQQRPNEVFTVHDYRTRTVSQTADRVARFAAVLREAGVDHGDRVAVLALNSDTYTELVLGIAWAGGAFNLVNTRWSPAEVAYSLKDSEARVLVVDDAFVAMVPRLREAYPGLAAVVYCGDGATPTGALNFEELIRATEPIEDVRRGGDAPAGLFYTGGTTGFPKGVVLTHTNLMTSALAGAAAHLGDPGGVHLHVAPMFHLADFTTWCIRTTIGGVHASLSTFTPTATLKAIADFGVTGTTLVPAMIQALVDAPDVGDYDLSSLRSILYGGSTIAESLLERAMSTFPNALFTQAYGMTEVAGIGTLLAPDAHAGRHHLRSAGRAAPHTEIRVLDEAGRQVEVGDVGEIAIRGGAVMPGYWRRPEETAQALREGWMHTGDAGFLDAGGYLHVVDRLKDMIVTGGENVYSAEVENAISSHPAVLECAVVAAPDPQWGERVHAVVVLRPGTSLELEGLRDHVKARIAGYKAPRSLQLIEGLPRSAAGKVRKNDLRDALREGSLAKA